MQVVPLMIVFYSVHRNSSHQGGIYLQPLRVPGKSGRSREAAGLWHLLSPLLVPAKHESYLFHKIIQHVNFSLNIIALIDFTFKTSHIKIIKTRFFFD